MSNDDYRDFESEDIDRAQYEAEMAEEREAPMDPNETLRELRAAMQTYLRGEATRDREVMADAAVDLYAYARELDTWLSRGGFLPDAWELDGTSGQDRKTYSDDQDRDNYTTGE